MGGKRQRHCLNLLDSPDEAGAKPLSVEDALMLKPPRRPAPSTIRPLLGSFVRMLVLPSLFHFKQEGLGSKCSLDIDNIAETLDKSSLCNMIWHPFCFFLHCVYHSTDDFLSGQRLHQPCSHAAMPRKAHSSPGCQSWKNSKPNRFLDELARPASHHSYRLL